MNYRILSITVLAATLALVAGAVADAQLKLNRLRANTDSAWNEVAAIHAQRLTAAKLALSSVANTGNPQLVADINNRLQRTAALPSSPALLDDPAALNAYKQGQGELTGALFMLAGSETAQSAQLAQLRAQLPDQEAALAAARERYREASAAYNARNSSVVAALLRNRPLAETI